VLLCANLLTAVSAPYSCCLQAWDTILRSASADTDCQYAPPADSGATGLPAVSGALPCEKLRTLSQIVPTADEAAEAACADEDGSCVLAHAIDRILSKVTEDAPAGQYHVFGMDPAILSREAQHLVADDKLQQRGFVGTGRVGWVWLPGAGSSEGQLQRTQEAWTSVICVLTGLADAGSRRSAEGQSMPAQQLPVSAASEVTAVFTLAAEDAAEVSAWDFDPWLQVCWVARVRIVGACQHYNVGRMWSASRHAVRVTDCLRE
jgi:hypothetical protein